MIEISQPRDEQDGPVIAGKSASTVLAVHRYNHEVWWLKMPSSDAFALKNSGLGDFLFAEVGTEENGSPLTILSVLARLGKDPWTEAAGWAKLPKAAAIDRLTFSISQMPLAPRLLAEARATAARLILLLPTEAGSLQKVSSAADAKSITPPWLPIAIFVAALGFGIAFEMIPREAPTNPATPVASGVVEHPEAPNN